MSKDLERVSKKHIDKSRLLFNQNLFESLKSCGVELSSASLVKIASLVKGKPQFQSERFKTQVSTEQMPSIILEHGASSCSFLIAIDNHGNVVSLHIPLILGPDGIMNRTGREAVLIETNFLSLIKDKLGPNRVILVTATGIVATQARKDALLSDLTHILEQPVQYLFLDDENHSEEKRDNLLIRIHKGVLSIFKGIRGDGSQLELLSDIIIIPSYISQTGKTELVIPYDKKSLLNSYHQLVASDKIRRLLVELI